MDGNEKIDGITITEAKERQMVSSLSRKELEDRYLRLREQHTELKKTSHKQEEKMKQMATKLLRLVKDKKKLDEGASIVDIEARDKVEELKTRVGALEKQNTQLKSKGVTPKKSLSTQQQKIKEQMRVQGTPPPVKRNASITTQQESALLSPKTSSPRGPILPQPRYGHSLLEETRLEKRELEDLVGNLQEQLHDYEDRVELLELQLQQRELNHEEELQKFRERVSGSQRSNIQDNVELIKLQREVKDKVTKLQHLQGKYQNLEELLGKVKKSHEQVLEEMDGITAKLKEEQNKNENLKNELKRGSISQQTLAQKEEEISDLKAEVDLLKEAHDKLLHSTFDVEKDREFRAKERQYQLRIAQLEATVKADVTEKNEVLDRLTTERDVSDASKKQFRELQVKYFELKEKHDDLTEKLKFFTKESAADFEEIQEALLLIKTKKERASQDLHFLEKVDDEVNKDLRKEIQELQASHADTINELEKTRSMLLIQHNINKDYQKEVLSTTKKMEELKRECDTRVKEYAQLLDIRAERIKKLEAQLRDVAYGTKQYKIKAEESVPEEEDEIDLKLERGQNVFEIHIGQIHVSKDGLSLFNGVEPMTFISYEFFEYELQTTPVLRGSRPDFNHTSQYVVQVDDFFLHYLQKESMKIEFHQAFGTEYKTMAKGNIRFNELLDKSHGRVHGKIHLFDVTDEEKQVVSIEYWIRLRVPMEQALRLYKERTKALGYIKSNDLQKLESPTKSSLKDSGINELKITIVQCLNLIPKVKDLQPCAYCIYKFFDFADHDTDIVKNSNFPQFHDQRSFPVPMTEELDNYLKNSNLEIYVFDDLDEEQASYLGMAAVPLISLSQDKSLKGKFLLKNMAGEETGAVEVVLTWEYTYLPASAKVIRKYPEPVQTAVEHNEIYAKPSRDTMQPMISAGKLFEPTITSSKKTMSENLKEEEILEPNKSSSRKSSILKSKENGSHRRLQRRVSYENEEAVASISEEQLKTMDIDELASVVESKPSVVQHEINEDSDDDDDDALFEAELTRSGKTNGNAGDTMFQEEYDEDSDEDDIVIPTSARQAKLLRQESQNEINGSIESSVAGSVVGSEDTEDDVVVSSLNRTIPSTVPSESTITIIISSLTLFEDAPVLKMDNIRQLFVSYKFLDYDPEQLETPMSLPKPKPNRPISFNFKKVFHVDEEHNKISRQYLLHLLMPDHPNEGRLFFTVVSDPMDDENAECEDIGIAYVDLIQLLREGRDYIDEDIDVYDLMESESEVIGSLTVTVEALDALKSLYQ